MHNSRQVAHLMGGNCAKTPPQLTYQSAKDFNSLRSLRNPDGTWMRIYFYETDQSGDFLSSISAIGEALKRQGEELGA